MKNSLQHKLSVWLTGSIVIAGLLAGGISFWVANDEAHEFQDDMLRQIALLVDADRLPPEGQRVSGALDNDPEARIIVSRIYPNPTFSDVASSLPKDIAEGFHTLELAGTPWRIFVHVLHSGEHIAVMQSTAVRSEAALDSALRTLLPLFGLIPLLILLSRWLVRVSLEPVHTLANQTDAQPENQPAILPPVEVPEEIQPFIQSINRLLGRVNRMISQQRRFIADAAHELRTPLTALSVQAQNLAQAGSLQIMQERIVPLQAGIERAKHLTEQLLSLAKTQAASERDREVNVGSLARELIAEYLPLANEKHIELVLDEITPSKLVAAPETLRLIMRNGLENALKYTPVIGPEKGQVTLRLLMSDSKFIVEIIDNGPGMPVAEIERAFEPFYRVQGSNSEGSGLGLAIAREAAERLGGKLTLQPRKDASGMIFRYVHQSGKRSNSQ